MFRACPGISKGITLRGAECVAVLNDKSTMEGNYFQNTYEDHAANAGMRVRCQKTTWGNGRTY
jgi:hypothetical protein